MPKVKVKVRVTRRERAKKDADKNIRKKVRVYRRKIARDAYDISSPVAVINKTDVDRYTSYDKRKRSSRYRPSRDITHTYKGVSYDDSQFLNVEDNKHIVRKRDTNNIFQKMFGNPVVYSVAGSTLHNVHQPTTTITTSGNIILSDKQPLNFEYKRHQPKSYVNISTGIDTPTARVDVDTQKEVLGSNFMFSKLINKTPEELEERAQHIKDKELELKKLNEDVFKAFATFDLIDYAASDAANRMGHHSWSDIYSQYTKQLRKTVDKSVLREFEDNKKMATRLHARDAYVSQLYKDLLQKDVGIEPFGKSLGKVSLDVFADADFIRAFKQHSENLRSKYQEFQKLLEGSPYVGNNKDSRNLHDLSPGIKHTYKIANISGADSSYVISDILLQHVYKLHKDKLDDIIKTDEIADYIKQSDITTKHKEFDKDDPITNLIKGIKDSLYTAWRIAHNTYPHKDKVADKELNRIINARAKAITLNRNYGGTIDEYNDKKSRDLEATVGELRIPKSELPDVESDDDDIVVEDINDDSILNVEPIHVYRRIMINKPLRDILKNIDIHEEIPAIVNGNINEQPEPSMKRLLALTEGANDVMQMYGKDIMNEMMMETIKHSSDGNPVMTAEVSEVIVTDDNEDIIETKMSEIRSMLESYINPNMNTNETTDKNDEE